MAAPTGPLAFARYRLPGIEVQPLKVLIVDEDKDVARTLARLVERMANVEAVVTSSAPEALQMVQEEAFDAAMVDLGLDAAGVDLLLAIREASPTTLRILLSAWPDENVAVGGAVFTGAHAYVLKPWNTPALTKTLDKLLKPRALRIASGPLLN